MNATQNEIQASARTLQVSFSAPRYSGGKYYIDEHHLVTGGGICADGYKYGHTAFDSFAEAEGFRLRQIEERQSSAMP